MFCRLIYGIITAIFGILHPAYSSYKAIRAKDRLESDKWMKYWIVFALFTSVECVTDKIIFWLPLYYEAKMAYILYLTSPVTEGSSIFYEKFVHPMLSQKENEIDACIRNTTDCAYSTFLETGLRGLQHGSRVFIETFVRFQPYFASHFAQEQLSRPRRQNIKENMNYVENDSDGETCARSRPIKKQVKRNTRRRPIILEEEEVEM